jgi:formylglycine-generating enzyme required for sulfatase activity
MGESVARVYNSSMKNLLVTMFVALLIVGCGKDDLPICPSCGERATVRMNPRVEVAEVKTYYKCAQKHNFNKDGVLVDYVGRPLKKKAPVPAPETPRPKPRTPPKKVSSAPMNLSTSAVKGKPFTIPDLSLEMLWVKPGTFEMGSPSSEKGSEDETLHTVTLTDGFYLGKHEVTQSQWEKVMGSNPSHFKGADRPVEKVSWTEVTSFCNKLTASERACQRG